MFKWLKKKFLYWLLDAKEIQIGELFNNSNPKPNERYNDSNELLFIEEGKCDFYVDSPDGLVKIKRTLKTVPLKIIEIQTKNNKIQCSEDHLLKSNGKFIHAKKLKINDYLDTEFQKEKIINTRVFGYDNCYDLEVEHENHQYYTNNFISHNSTCMVSYILWYSQFHSNKTILISGNKYSAAMENMDRIRDSYQAMDNWIKRGVVEYNKGTLRFDNGTKIIASATTPDAGRGRSVNLLFLDELAFVREKFARDYWSAIQPTLGQTKGKCIIASTPRADTDLFYEIWKGANQLFDESGEPFPNGVGENGFKALFYPWYVHPERDAEWEKQWIAKLGQKRFAAEMSCISPNTYITIKDGQNQIKKITIEELKNLLKDTQ